MSICQRKDGRFVVKYKDEAGHWRQKGFRDRSAAEAFEGENLYRMRRKTPPFRAGDIRRVRRICVSN